MQYAVDTMARHLLLVLKSLMVIPIAMGSGRGHTIEISLAHLSEITNKKDVLYEMVVSVVWTDFSLLISAVWTHCCSCCCFLKQGKTEEEELAGIS